MNLLLISNSTNSGEEFLHYPLPYIKRFIGAKPCRAIFIPYAGVTLTYSEYESKVKSRFQEMGHDLVSIHNFDDPIKVLKEFDVIVVGGGNSFRLVQLLHEKGLIGEIKKRVLEGTPYIGWSAGANVASPTIRTTNDMPIVEPHSLSAFGLIKFQINPHYLDANPANHAGETREMRINEFLELNRDVYVAGLREGTMINIENSTIRLQGNKPVRIFHYGKEPVEYSKSDNLQFLID